MTDKDKLEELSKEYDKLFMNFGRLVDNQTKAIFDLEIMLGKLKKIGLVNSSLDLVSITKDTSGLIKLLRHNLSEVINDERTSGGSEGSE